MVKVSGRSRFMAFLHLPAWQTSHAWEQAIFSIYDWGAESSGTLDCPPAPKSNPESTHLYVRNLYMYVYIYICTYVYMQFKLRRMVQASSTASHQPVVAELAPRIFSSPKIPLKQTAELP